MQPKVTKARGEEYVLTKAWMNSNKVTSVTTQDGKPLEGNLLDPEQTYIANQWQGDYQMVPVGGMTANAKKLYGDEKTFKNLLASKKDVDFWEDNDEKIFSQTKNVPAGNLPKKKLEELKDLFDQGLISEDEYKRLKAKVLGL